MSKTAFRLVTAAVVWIACVAAVRAAPLQPERVPADATWMIHVDVDRLRDSMLWELLQPALGDNAAYRAKVRELEEVSGATYPRDLHSLTLYGCDFTEQGVTLQIHAGADVDRILRLLKRNPRYRSYQVGNRLVFSWEDQGRQLFGCFYQGDRLVMGWSQKALEHALAVIDGREAGLKADSPLAGGLPPAAGPAPLLSMACLDLASLRQEGLVKSPLLAPVHSAWMRLGDEGGIASVQARAQTDGPDSAEHLRVSVEGLKAIAALADTDGRDPQARVRALLAQGISVTAGGAAVDLSWRANLKDLWPPAAGRTATDQVNVTTPGKK